jgi:hypothetical protein
VIDVGATACAFSLRVVRPAYPEFILSLIAKSALKLSSVLLLRHLVCGRRRNVVPDRNFHEALAAALYVVPNGAGVNQDLVPNSKLRPERVKSYDAGIRGQFSRGYFSATVFKAGYTDFIQNFVPIPGRTFKVGANYAF